MKFLTFVVLLIAILHQTSFAIRVSQRNQQGQRYRSLEGMYELFDVASDS